MQSRVIRWWVFAGMLLGLSGVLNVIWGIAAIGNSVAAGLASVDALLSIPGSPFWSICVFALSIVTLFELAKAPESDGA